MTTKIPKPRTEVTPLIATRWYIEYLKQELIALENCMRSVPEYPLDRVNRAKRNAIDKYIREQYYYGWTKGSSTNFLGVLYREDGFHKTIEDFLNKSNTDYRKNLNRIEKLVTIEHVIPVAALRNKLLEYLNSDELDKKLAESILSPVALLDKKSIKKIKDVATIDDLEYPFRRYSNCDIKIRAHNSTPVSDNWNMEDHWKLVYESLELRKIMDEYHIGA